MYERCPRNPAMQVRRVSEIMIATRKGRQNRSTSGRAFPQSCTRALYSIHIHRPRVMYRYQQSANRNGFQTPYGTHVRPAWTCCGGDAHLCSLSKRIPLQSDVISSAPQTPSRRVWLYGTGTNHVQKIDAKGDFSGRGDRLHHSPLLRSPGAQQRLQLDAGATTASARSSARLPSVLSEPQAAF